MNMNKDVFAQMKNEDRKFGERNVKVVSAKNQPKRDKHHVNFKNVNLKDIMAMSDDMDLEEEMA